jgi:hypothetical protein
MSKLDRFSGVCVGAEVGSSVAVVVIVIEDNVEGGGVSLRVIRYR